MTKPKGADPFKIFRDSIGVGAKERAARMTHDQLESTGDAPEDSDSADVTPNIPEHVEDGSSRGSNN
jgi:hypothetical protein